VGAPQARRRAPSGGASASIAGARGGDVVDAVAPDPVVADRAAVAAELT
jgi:hypothetical protein